MSMVLPALTGDPTGDHWRLATTGDLATWRPGDLTAYWRPTGDLLATYWLYLLATWRPTAQVCYCVARSAKAENVCGARSAKAEIACGARSANDSAKPLLINQLFFVI